MANLEIEGRIRQKLAKLNGQGVKGSWTRQDFVLEYQDGNYPAEVCFTAFGNDKVADLDKYQVGDQVRVAFNLRAREYNGRWYNDVRVWRISPAGQQEQTRQGSGPAPRNPEPQQTYGVRPQAAPDPTIDDLPAEDPSNDLPF